MNRRTVLELTIAGLAGAWAAGGPARAASAPEFAPLFRGFNIAGWSASDPSGEAAPELLGELRSRGFNSVRLPVDGDILALGDAASKARILGGLDRALALLTEAGYRVMVDLHPGGALAGLLQNVPEEGALAAAGAWLTLRDVVADYPPERVFPELLNEPPMEQQAWLSLRRILAGIVRERCPDHTLVWGAARFQGTWETLETPPLDDRNAIAAVHFYWPMAFTHQCAEWLSSPLRDLTGIRFPAGADAAELADLTATLRSRGDEEAIGWLHEQFASPWSVSAIDEEFARLRRWSEANSCPVVLNEFGVLKACAPTESRLRWTRAVREAAEANGMGWIYWELDAGFGFVGAGQGPAGIDSGMVAALLG